MFRPLLPQVFGFKTSAATSQGGRAVTQTGAGQRVPRVTCSNRVIHGGAASNRARLRGIAKLIGEFQRRRLLLTLLQSCF